MQELLSSIQPRVYAICSRILRDRQDSEDATQEVLLKLASREIEGVQDVQAWVSRVAVTTALDLRRRRRARRDAERRRPAARQDDGAEAREALGRALADLDDEPREVLIERYIEGRSLRSMAARRGCTSVAVWYRILRAKARLKERLVRGGFAGLLGAALASLGAGRSAAAVRALGGVALGGALLAGGLAAAVAASARPEPLPPVPVARRVAQGPPPAVAPARAAAPEGAVEQDPSVTARMERLRDWFVATRPAVQALEERFKDDPQGLARAHEPFTKEYDALIDGLRGAVFADPEAYLAFLRPIHDARLLFLLLFPLTRQPDGELEGAPDALVRGLSDLLVEGSEIQRQEILGRVWHLRQPPAALEGAYDRLLAAPTPEVRRLALMALGGAGLLHERHRPALQAMALGGGDPMLVSQAVSSLTVLPSADDFLFEQLTENEDPDVMDALAEHLPSVLARNRGRADRSVGALARAFSLVSRKPVQSEAVYYGSDGYFYRRLVYVTLDGLPAGRAREVLASAVAHAPTVQTREGTRMILAAIDAGETRRDALVALYQRALNP